MPKARVIGVDPGPTPGICLLREDGEPWVLQCNHEAAVDVVRSLMDIDGASPEHRILAVEKFVVGRRAARSATAKAGETTRNLIGELQALDKDAHLRPATQIKAWATDKRLEAAGLLDKTKGMPHARDAARHALYAAVHDGGWHDPLSKKAKEK